jgi:hypothetical protein
MRPDETLSGIRRRGMGERYEGAEFKYDIFSTL